MVRIGKISALAAIAAIGFVAFLIWELTECHPIVDLRIFRHRGFAASIATLTMGYGALFAVNVLTPQWLQTHMGYTSVWAGMTTAWSGVFAVFVAPIVGVRLNNVDPRRLIFIGLIWLAMVTASRAFVTDDNTYWQIAAPLMLTGIGLPFFFVPLTTLSLGNVLPHEVASAAGLLNFLRTLSGAVATSLVTTAWDDRSAYAQAELGGATDRSGAALQSMMHHGFSHDQALAALSQMAAGQGVTIATNEVMALVTLAFGAAAFIIWFAPKPARVVDITEAGH